MKFIYLLLITTITIACGKASVELESRLSNEQAYASLSEHEGNHLKLQGLFEDLSLRAGSNFDWEAWWHHLSETKFTMPATQEEAWNSLLKLSQHVCSNTYYGFPQSFFNFLQVQRNVSDFRPSSVPLRFMRSCRESIPDSVAYNLILKEIKHPAIDFSLLNYYAASLKPASINSIPSDSWKSLASQMKMNANRSTYSGEINKFVESLSANRLIETRVISFFVPVLNVQNGKGEALFSDSTRFLVLRSQFNNSFNSAKVLNWWRETSRLGVSAMLKENYDVVALVEFHREVIDRYELLDRKSARENGEDFRRWLAVTDELLDNLANSISEEKSDQVIAHLSHSPSPLASWLLSIMKGRVPVDAEFSPFTPLREDNEVQRMPNPLGAWLEYRATLRSYIDEDFWPYGNNFRNRPYPPDRWWGYNNSCPIPNPNSPFTFNLAWVELSEIPEELGVGCFRYIGESPISISNLKMTHDSLLVLPSTDLTVNEINGGILDLSGEFHKKYEYEVRRQDAVVLPVIIIAPNKLNGKNYWFLFHFVAQQAGSTSIFPELPPKAEDSGSMILRGPAERATWIRMKGAPATPGHPQISHGLASSSISFIGDEFSSRSEPWDELQLLMTELAPGAEYIGLKPFGQNALENLKLLDFEQAKILSLDAHLKVLGKSLNSSDLFLERLSLWLGSPVENVADLWSRATDDIIASASQMRSNLGGIRSFSPFHPLVEPAYSTRTSSPAFLEEGKSGEKGEDGVFAGIQKRFLHVFDGH